MWEDDTIFKYNNVMLHKYLQSCNHIALYHSRVHCASVFLIPFKVCSNWTDLKIRVTYNYYNYVNVAFLLIMYIIICSIPTFTLTHTQPRDPCPAYPVGRYNFTITERDTDQLVTSVTHTGNISLVVGRRNGLVANRIYMLTIEALNAVGSSISEDEILFCKHIHIIKFCPYSAD